VSCSVACLGISNCANAVLMWGLDAYIHLNKLSSSREYRIARMVDGISANVEFFLSCRRAATMKRSIVTLSIDNVVR
jgi:hypothetical protein